MNAQLIHKHFLQMSHNDRLKRALICLYPLESPVIIISGIYYDFSRNVYPGMLFTSILEHASKIIYSFHRLLVLYNVYENYVHSYDAQDLIEI